VTVYIASKEWDDWYMANKPTLMYDTLLADFKASEVIYHSVNVGDSFCTQTRAASGHEGQVRWEDIDRCGDCDTNLPAVRYA
jgi:uncharacterized protein YcnI